MWSDFWKDWILFAILTVLSVMTVWGVALAVEFFSAGAQVVNVRPIH